MMTEKLFEWAVLAIALSGFCILIVLVVRRAVARWLGARWAYYLWLTPLLGLLALAIPTQSVQRALNVTAIELPVLHSAVVKTTSALNLAGESSQQATTQRLSTRGINLVGLALLLWMLGCLSLLAVFAQGSAKSSNTMRRLSNAASDQQLAIIRSRSASLVERYSLPVRMLSTNRGPAVVGMFQPVLYLPADFFQRFSVPQQLLILEHEARHLARHDLVALLMARIYRCLFWFNPLVYIAEKYLRLDQELSVDEAVLSSKDRSTRRLYGETLLQSSAADSGFAQVSYSPSFGQIRQRTQMLKHYQVHTGRSILGGLFLAVFISFNVAYSSLAVLEFKPESVIAEARALAGKASVQFMQENYPAAIKSLKEMERISTTSLTAQDWALYGQALLKLNRWEQGLEYMNRAILLSEANGQVPKQDWLLVQTALEWKLGDSPAAAISLERSIQFYPETTHQDTLTVLNELLQDVWVPVVGSDSLAQL